MANVSLTDKLIPTILSGVDRITMQKQGLDIPFRWKYLGYATGDSSGGIILGEINLGGMDSSLYYFITRIMTYTDETGAEPRLEINTDEWQRFHVDGIADQPLIIWESVTNVRGTQERDALTSGIIPMGRPSNDASGGKLYPKFTTNTENAVYTFFVEGYALTNPIPLLK